MASFQASFLVRTGRIEKRLGARRYTMRRCCSGPVLARHAIEIEPGRPPQVIGVLCTGDRRDSAEEPLAKADRLFGVELVQSVRKQHSSRVSTITVGELLMK